MTLKIQTSTGVQNNTVNTTTVWERIESAEAQLAEKASKVFVTPEEFGAKGDGVTDDSDALILAHSTGTKVIYNKFKTYRITKTLEITTVQDIDFNNSTITGNITPLLKINIAHSAIIDGVGGKYANLTIDCGTNIGLSVASSRQAQFKNIKFTNVKSTAFEYLNGWENNFKNFYFYGDGVSNNLAMRVTAGDSEFYNMYGYDMKKFLKCSGINLYKDIHAWIYTQSLISGSVFIELDGGIQRFSGCYSDTYEKAFNFTTITTATISEFFYFINESNYPLADAYCFYYNVASENYVNLVSGTLQGSTNKNYYLSNKTYHGNISNNVFIYNFVAGTTTDKALSLINVNALVTNNISKIVQRNGSIIVHLDFNVDLTSQTAGTLITLFNCSGLTGKDTVAKFDLQSGTSRFNQITGYTYAYLDYPIQLRVPDTLGKYHCTLHIVI